jgi:hypothetical protein
MAHRWINLNKRLSPNTSPIPSTHMHTDEIPTPMPTAALPQSFGNDFNLIRAVEEYGPQRVESIRNELVHLAKRQTALTEEMQTLERLIAVTKPNGVAAQDIAWATVDGYTAAADELQELREAREQADMAMLELQIEEARQRRLVRNPGGIGGVQGNGYVGGPIEDAPHAHFGNGFEMD